MPTNYPNRRKTKRIQAIDDTGLGLPRLTKKQESFVQAILAGKSKRDAYRLAYDASGMAESSISVECWKLLQKPQIAQSIRILQRIGLEESSVTKENHLTELARLRELAIENQQISAGVQAEHYRGRVAGLYNDKIDLRIGPSTEVLLGQITELLGSELAEALAPALGVESEDAATLNRPPLLELTRDNKDLGD